MSDTIAAARNVTSISFQKINYKLNLSPALRRDQAVQYFILMHKCPSRDIVQQCGLTSLMTFRQNLLVLNYLTEKLDPSSFMGLKYGDTRNESL